MLVTVSILVTILFAGVRAESANDVNPHITSSEFVTPANSVRPGGSITTLAVIKFNAGAHSYWINNGDTGMPPDIRYVLPQGVELLETKYELPHKLAEGGIVDYVYDGKMRIVSRFKLADDFEGSEISIGINALLLVCDSKCVADSAKGEIVLPVSNRESMPDIPLVARIENLQDHFPIHVSTNASATVIDEGMHIKIELPKGRKLNYYFYPEQGGVFANEDVQNLKVVGNTLNIYLKKSPYFSEYPSEISGVLYSPEPWHLDEVSHGMRVKMKVKDDSKEKK